MNFTLPACPCSKCFHIAALAILYLFLSVSIAFLCHRLYFHDTPAADAIKSVFAGCVFLFTMWGLIWWTAFRVFVFLLIPRLFNINGRTVLIAYISYLTLSGPLWNTKQNIGVMSTTLVCSFEEIRAATKELVDFMREPVVYIKHLIDTMEERAKKIFAQLADDLQNVRALAEKMIQYFRKAVAFLKRLSTLCVDKLGTPIEHCTRTVRETIEECEVDHDNTICSLLIALYPLCAPLAALDVFCIELDYNFLDLEFVEYLEKGFLVLLGELEKFVDVDVVIDGDFKVVTNNTKSYEKIRQDVLREFGERTKDLFVYLSATRVISIALSFYLFFSVYRFRRHYLTKLHFQNRYLLRSLNEINELRMSRGAPSVFPLNYAEERHFIVIYSWRVTYWEVVQAIRGILNVIGPCFYVFCITFGDYALYYLLRVISRESQDASIASPAVIQVAVNGEGFAANFMHSLVDTFVPIVNGFNIDFGVCAPQPQRPDEGRLITLFLLCLFVLIQGIVYPFAARFMHLIMERYYVEETRRRMAWLYNDILRRRQTLHMMIYERLSGKYGEGEEDPIPVMAWLRSECGDNWVCHWWLGAAGDPGSEFCVNCAKTLAGSRERVGFFRCPTYGCSAVYCRDCIRQLNWVCILCKKNVYVQADYGLALAEEEEVDISKF